MRRLIVMAAILLTSMACAPMPAEGQQVPTTGAVQPASIRLLVTSGDVAPTRLVTDVAAQGCTAETLALVQGGQWLLYIQGAPPQVNAPFPSQLPTGTTLLARCSPPPGVATPPAKAAPNAPNSPNAPATSGPRPPASALPTWGVFDDGYPADSPTLANIAASVGRPAGVVSWYVHAAATYPPGTEAGQRWDDNVARVRRVHAAGEVPLITWEMWKDATPGANPMPLADIAAGRFDAYFDSWAAGVKTVSPGVVYLRIFHEMNLTGQYPWSVYPGDRFRNSPAQLSAAWRHIVGRFEAAGVTNVRWVFNPGGDLTNNPLPPGAYPGDAYVDYIGLDVYDTAPRGSLALDYPLLEAIANKPWLHGEVGGGSAWVTSELAPFVRRRPMTVVWFNAGQWELNGSQNQAIRAMLDGLP